MSKGNRCEAIALLLGGLGCLVGCETTLGLKKPSLPEECVWITFPYSWHCFELPKWKSGVEQGADGDSRAPDGERSPDPTDRGDALEDPHGDSVDIVQ